MAADTALDRYVTETAGPQQRKVAAGAARGGVGSALLAVVTLNGVPANLALGVSLAEGASLALLVAIFCSNLPASLVGGCSRSRSASPAARCARRSPTP